MKHHCHCGLEKHLHRFRVKKFGLLGAALMILHILFHVVECLLLPSIFVALGGHLHEEDALATSSGAIIIEADTTTSTICWHYQQRGVEPVSVQATFAYPYQISDMIHAPFESLYCE